MKKIEKPLILIVDKDQAEAKELAARLEEVAIRTEVTNDTVEALKMVKRKAKKKGMKVGQTKITMRKIDGKRRKVRVTKKARGRYSVKVVAKKGGKRKARKKSRR